MRTAGARAERRSRRAAGPLAEAGPWIISATESVAGLSRLVLVLRLAATLMLVVAAALITPAPLALALGSAIAVLVTAAELGALTRRPELVARWGWFAGLELVASAGIVTVMHGGPVFFSFSCGSAAVLGVGAGPRAWPYWVVQTVAGYGVVAWVVRADDVPARLAVYLTGVPTLYILVGLAATAARGAVLRHVRLARSALAGAERAAVATERGRMARELHDSVEKTLRGLSLAAQALPAALTERPDLAADLARTVATGADTAADEARDLLGLLRADDLDGSLRTAIESTCAGWSAQTSIPLVTDLAEVEVRLPVRHELLRIVREALGNVARHARAGHVWVVLSVDDADERGPAGSPGAAMELVIQDDGVGFEVPADLADLAGAGHYGLVGMAERAAEVGGRLRVWSDPASGTQVVLRAPAGRT